MLNQREPLTQVQRFPDEVHIFFDSMYGKNLLLIKNRKLEMQLFQPVSSRYQHTRLHGSQNKKMHPEAVDYKL